MKIMGQIVLLTTLAAGLSAQSNDFVGIVVESGGVTTPTARVRTYPPCGTAFNCTPLVLNGTAGDTIKFYVMSTFNGLVVLAGTFDTTQVCIPIPGVANSLVFPPSGALQTLWLGFATVPDNGRCNGGATPLTTLVQIPAGFPSGSIGLQAAAEAPTAGGGTGFAFSHSVLLSW